MRGPITLGAKRAGKPGAGEPHAGFDVAGAGDGTMGAGLRPEAKAEDEPPDPTVRAPVLDPTGEGWLEKDSPSVQGPMQAEHLASHLLHIPYDNTWDRSGEVGRAAFQRQVLADLVQRKV